MVNFSEYLLQQFPIVIVLLNFGSNLTLFCCSWNSYGWNNSKRHKQNFENLIKKKGYPIHVKTTSIYFSINEHRFCSLYPLPS